MAGCRLEYVRVFQCPLVGYTVHPDGQGLYRAGSVGARDYSNGPPELPPGHLAGRDAASFNNETCRDSSPLPCFSLSSLRSLHSAKGPCEEDFTFWPPFYGATVLHWQLLAST